MSGQFSGKRVLVTGAGSGIGAATALAFGKQGASVAVHARTVEKAAPTVEALKRAGAQAFAVAADLLDAGAIKDMAAAVLDKHGGLDVLVNNAGVVGIGSVIDMDEDLWDRTIDTNLKAPWLVTRAVLPAMLQSALDGRLIYVSSISARIAEPSGSAYNASKAGLIGFMRCVAAEVAPRGLTANAICPGWVDTPMAEWCWTQAARDEGKALDALYDTGMRANMMNVIVEPTDVAEFAVFLATKQARYITGQSVNVCGGMVCS